MTPRATALEKLHRAHPEWKPWLSVIETVVEECRDEEWDAFVPEMRAGNEAPRLAGVTISVQTGALERWMRRLAHVAARCGAPRLAGLKAPASGSQRTLALFQAALLRDEQALGGFAEEWGAEPDAFRAFADLLPVPFLQACGRHAGPFEIWSRGFCPVCAGWPAFTEVRGIERNRFLRCGRCGVEWPVSCLQCPYCNTTEHDRLTTLVPGDGNRNRMIEACQACRGYVKSFTVLQASVPSMVMVGDLESVDLDIAGIEQGFKRPAGSGFPLELKLEPGGKRRKRSFSLWNG
jgi:FdhE protein